MKTNNDQDLDCLRVAAPIAFQRVFVTWTGSVNAALMLSQLAYWTLVYGWGKWVYKTSKHWEEELGLTVEMQSVAREKLKLSGLVEERKADIPPKLYYRLNKDALIKRYRSNFRQSPKSNSGKAPKQSGEKPQSNAKTTITKTTSTESTIRSADGVDSKKGFFKMENDYPPFIKNRAHQLENFVRSHRQLDMRIKRSKWYHEMSLLLQTIRGDKSRLRQVLDAYTKTPHIKHTPRANCAESFRKKFLSIEDWANEYAPPPPKEEYEVIIESRRTVE